MSDVRKIQTVAIIGAHGQMGGLFADRCRALGQEVRGIGRPLTPEKLEQAIKGADLLLLSVPAKAMESVLELVVPFLEPPQILIDNVSVKAAPLQSMLKHYNGAVVGTHPLFGPNPPEEARVVITPGRDEEACEAVFNWMQELGYLPFYSTAEEHDKALGGIQALNFVTSVSYLAALSHNEDIHKFLTPSFQRRLDADRKMITQDAELFSTLFETNPYGQEIVRSYRNFLQLAAGGDIELLVERAKWWFKEDESEK